MAYLTTPPTKLFFWCDTPSEKDGETPLLLSSLLLEKIKEKKEKFLNKLIEKKVIYTRQIDDKKNCEFKLQRSW